MDLSQVKSDALSESGQLLPLSLEEKPDFLLQLQLQKEVDRLGLLLEEVKKQSAKVQEAADAIGDNLVSEQLENVLSSVRRNDGSAPLKMGACK
jgi:hypothetical protein